MVIDFATRLLAAALAARRAMRAMPLAIDFADLQTWRGPGRFKRMRAYESTGGRCHCCGAQLALEPGRPNSFMLDALAPAGNAEEDDLELAVPVCRLCRAIRAAADLTPAEFAAVAPWLALLAPERRTTAPGQAAAQALGVELTDFSPN